MDIGKWLQDKRDERRELRRMERENRINNEIDMKLKEVEVTSYEKGKRDGYNEAKVEFSKSNSNSK